jgi:hypothetical protein
MRRRRENDRMATAAEPVSPELVLVDPELAASLRAAALEPVAPPEPVLLVADVRRRGPRRPLRVVAAAGACVVLSQAGGAAGVAPAVHREFGTLAARHTLVREVTFVSATSPLDAPGARAVTWRPVAGARRYDVVIWNRSGARRELRVRRAGLAVPRSLSPGRYLYLVYAAGRLAAWGGFTVDGTGARVAAGAQTADYHPSG